MEQQALFQLTICRTTPSPFQIWPNCFSVPKCCAMFLKRVKKQFFNFCGFQFLRFGRFCTQNISNIDKKKKSRMSKNKLSQKMRNVLKRIRLFANLIQKRYPVIPDNQRARGIQSKSIRTSEPMIVGAALPTKQRVQGGGAPLICLPQLFLHAFHILFSNKKIS